jgi:hypothetical protein
MARIDLEEDGFVAVNVWTIDAESGEKVAQTVNLDVGLADAVIGDAARAWRDDDGESAAWVRKLQEIFASLGVGGLSGKAALALSEKILEMGKEQEKKSEPTPVPASAPESASPTS